MASSRIKMDDYENATKLEEDLEIYEEIETAHDDIKNDSILKFRTAHGNIKKDIVLKAETAHGNIKNDTVFILSLRKWLQFVLLPLLIVSFLSISLILTVAYFALYAELEEKLEKKYAFLMTKQNISATEMHAKGNEARAELELKMEKKYEFLIAKQNATEIHALANEARVALTGCVTSTQTFTDNVVRFSTVNFYVGINNLDTFKSKGKFVCEIPGLYYISAHKRTSNENYFFDVRKNNIPIASSISDSGDTNSANPISAVVELYVNDTLYVSASSTNIERTYSCLSLMKVK